MIQLNQWGLVLPEIVLLSTACFILIADLFIAPAYKWLTSCLVLGSIAGAGWACWPLLHAPLQILFAEHWVIDSFTQHLKLFTLFILFFVCLYSFSYNREAKIHQGELYVLMLLSTLGMFAMISAHTTLTLYLGLELLALGTYAMVAMTHHRVASVEAAMKYFVMGAVASGMLLYGLSLLYGAAGGHLVLSEIPKFLFSVASERGNIFMVNFSIIFIMVGIAFKFGIAPFHAWVPDVYQGAPTSVATFIGAVPKMAAFALLFRLWMEAYQQFMEYWPVLTMGLGLLSIVLGNLFAIAQTSMKRLLAYSSISHMGFVFLGFSVIGLTGSLFYMMVYALTALAGFGVLLTLKSDGHEIDSLSDFKGLAKQAPIQAFVMMLVMFSMAGIPPMVGFFAKLNILLSLVKAGELLPMIVALVMSVVGAFYYLRVIKLMYFDVKPNIMVRGTGSRVLQTTLTLNGLSLLAFGLFPGIFWLYVKHSFAVLTAG